MKAADACGAAQQPSQMCKGYCKHYVAVSQYTRNIHNMTPVVVIICALQLHMSSFTYLSQAEQPNKQSRWRACSLLS